MSKRPSFDIGTRSIRAAAWITRAKFTHGSLAIVQDGEGSILLVQQRYRDYGLWGLPGGFLNYRESPAEAAVRELGEEVHLDLSKDALDTVAAYQQPWAWHFDHLFTAVADRQEHESALRDRKARFGEIKTVAWHRRAALPVLTRAAALAFEVESTANGSQRG